VQRLQAVKEKFKGFLMVCVLARSSCSSALEQSEDLLGHRALIWDDFCEIVTLFSPPPHQDWGRARTACNRFARDDKEPGPSWGKQSPGERPRETAET
jgi:hypothetical protein